jgi:aspartate aminotransferase-like enzyme
VDVKKMIQVLRDEKSVVLAGGQRDLDGKIFRIGHLGLVEESDMDKVASALSAVLFELGYRK